VILKKGIFIFPYFLFHRKEIFNIREDEDMRCCRDEKAFALLLHLFSSGSEAEAKKSLRTGLI